jgi:hypothetical protein
MLIMKLIASIFLLASMVGFTYMLLNPNAVPGDNPGYGSIVFILMGALGIPLLLEVVQRIMGVSGYSVNEVGIIVYHRIGETRIPFEAIEYASLDRLYSYVPRGPKNSRGELTTVARTENCVVTGTGRMFGPYFSVRDGICVLLKLKEKESRIALTPESAEEMFELIKGHTPGRYESVFQDGKRNALQSNLTIERIKEVMARIEDQNIQLLDILPEKVLVNLKHDADYRAGYLEGLKSMLTDAKEEIDIDGLMKKMRL